MNLADIADAIDNDGLDAVDWDRRQAEIELSELLEVFCRRLLIGQCVAGRELLLAGIELLVSKANSSSRFRFCTGSPTDAVRPTKLNLIRVPFSAFTEVAA